MILQSLAGIILEKHPIRKMNFHGHSSHTVTFANNFTLTQKEGGIIEYSDKHRNRKFSIHIQDKKLNEEVSAHCKWCAVTEVIYKETSQK